MILAIDRGTVTVVRITDSLSMVLAVTVEQCG